MSKSELSPCESEGCAATAQVSEKQCGGLMEEWDEGASQN